MATNPHPHGSSPHSGQGHGFTTRWLLSGLGFVWLLRTALRAKGRHVTSPAADDASDHNVLHAKPVRAHEQRDANAAWILGIVAFLLISGLCVHFILAGALAALKRSPPPTDLWRPTQQARQPIPSPGSFPALQISPPADLQAFRTREVAELHSYGWINHTAGIVRVPIERAMELVLQQGLAVRAGTKSNQTGPSPAQLIQQRLDPREPQITGEQ